MDLAHAEAYQIRWSKIRTVNVQGLSDVEADMDGIQPKETQARQRSYYEFKRPI